MEHIYAPLHHKYLIYNKRYAPPLGTIFTFFMFSMLAIMTCFQWVTRLTLFPWFPSRPWLSTPMLVRTLVFIKSAS